MWRDMCNFLYQKVLVSDVEITFAKHIEFCVMRLHLKTCWTHFNFHFDWREVQFIELLHFKNTEQIKKFCLFMGIFLLSRLKMWNEFKVEF